MYYVVVGHISGSIAILAPSEQHVAFSDNTHLQLNTPL